MTVERFLRIGLLGFALCSAAGAQEYEFELVHAFGGGPSHPAAGLIQAPDGFFYGTTTLGGLGASDEGTIFRMTPSGHITTLHSLTGDPRAALVLAADGYLYGTTRYGGDGLGIVFKTDLTGHLTALHSFTGVDGSKPIAAMIQASDGNLYGTTSEGGEHEIGTVFRVNPLGAVTTVHSFSGPDGNTPTSALVEADDGYLYGTTLEGGSSNHGTVFRIAPSGGFTTIHSLTGLEGAYPYAGLIQASDGQLYGLTAEGGANGNGTAFRITTAGSLTKLHDFVDADEGWFPTNELVEATNGTFYGKTSLGGAGSGGAVFRMDSAGHVTVLHFFGTGWNDDLGAGGLIEAADGNLYGLTRSGGANGVGIAFRVDLSDSFTTIGSLGDSAGTNPYAPLLQAPDGNFYGTTASNGGINGGPMGGPGATGAIFKLDPSGSVTTLHVFDGTDGANPRGALIRATDGYFYGTTMFGGSGCEEGCGTVFRMDAAGTLTTLHAFDNSDGAWPEAGLIEAADGNFYGTTNGYSYNGCPFYTCGTVFRMDVSGDVMSLHVFAGADGSNPRAALLEATDGNLYGTTSAGGAAGCGTVFRIDAKGTFATLHDFSSADGCSPLGTLIQAADGDLYGTTIGGGLGPFCCGTAFKIDLSGTLTTLHVFQGSADGSEPMAGLLEATDGNFYGTTNWNSPTIFRMDPAGNVTQLPSSVDFPAAPLIQAADGSLYGTAPDLGPWGGGVIYRLSTASIAVDAITPSSGPADGSMAVDVFGGGFAAGATLSIGGIDVPSAAVLGSALIFATELPALTPGTLNHVVVTNPGNAATTTSATLAGDYFADFLDVPATDIFHDSVEEIFRAGVTAGCGGGLYCRDNPVRRDQMAVFLLKAEHGAAYVPSACAGVFPDAPCPGPFTDWIEQLAAEQITGGCGGGNYCPASPVTRAQMAVFLLKTEHGSGFAPPTCNGVFGDVGCPSQFADWIETLYGEGITGGCSTSPLLYCPGNSVTRGQMAAFLVKAFHLP